MTRDSKLQKRKANGKEIGLGNTQQSSQILAQKGARDANSIHPAANQRHKNQPRKLALCPPTSC